MNDAQKVDNAHGSAGTVGLPADMTRNNSNDPSGTDYKQSAGQIDGKGTLVADESREGGKVNANILNEIKSQEAVVTSQGGQQ